MQTIPKLYGGNINGMPQGHKIRYRDNLSKNSVEL